MQYEIILALSLASGVLGTALGGGLAFFLGNPKDRTLSAVMSFCAGLMLAVVCFDLIPSSLASGGFALGFGGVLFGVGTGMVVDSLIMRLKRDDKVSPLVRAGLMLVIGVALHNFPEGLAVGVGFIKSVSYGVGMCLVIALHDIFEGIAMVTPLVAGGWKAGKAFWYAALSGLPTALGAGLGLWAGEISQWVIDFSLAYAGGAMLYVVVGELMPEAYQLHRGRFNVMGLCFGVMAGIALTAAF
ncbi:ZIP family metal transporter [Gehongia tenuis]|uniref:ZIP family metal transporter n=1 Tax=Gehongia tenuis TaxID=2763655 RepID=A0A926D5N5_9FIRM|nr:ZIP family metal transporter [Gehongia tenuis]MBC8531701.1 ZIP family metal transporter [Gehongia tenuis]